MKERTTQAYLFSIIIYMIIVFYPTITLGENEYYSDVYWIILVLGFPLLMSSLHPTKTAHKISAGLFFGAYYLLALYFIWFRDWLGGWNSVFIFSIVSTIFFPIYLYILARTKKFHGHLWEDQRRAYWIKVVALMCVFVIILSFGNNYFAGSLYYADPNPRILQKDIYDTTIEALEEKKSTAKSRCQLTIVPKIREKCLRTKGYYQVQSYIHMKSIDTGYMDDWKYIEREGGFSFQLPTYWEESLQPYWKSGVNYTPRRKVISIDGEASGLGKDVEIIFGHAYTGDSRTIQSRVDTWSTQQSFYHWVIDYTKNDLRPGAQYVYTLEDASSHKEIILHRKDYKEYDIYVLLPDNTSFIIPFTMSDSDLHYLPNTLEAFFGSFDIVSSPDL